MEEDKDKRDQPRKNQKKNTAPEGNAIHRSNLEEDNPTNLQKKIEDSIDHDEQTLEGEELSSALSRGRTHMSEHRTKMSEHRTNLSEHRTDLSEHRTDLSDHRTDLSETRTSLSYQRTAVSYERTLMSWIRTAVSLISFGFTIYKFFEEVHKTRSDALVTPRAIGMIMIGFGVVGLLLAQIQHEIAYKKLRKASTDVQRSLSSVLGILILLVGFFLFVVALFRQ